MIRYAIRLKRSKAVLCKDRMYGFWFWARYNDFDKDAAPDPAVNRDYLRPFITGRTRPRRTRRFSS